jgi:endonuclease III
VDWDAVRLGSMEKLFEAIKTGGMANVKSQRVKGTLDDLYFENQRLRTALADTAQYTESIPGKKSTDPTFAQLLEIIKDHDDATPLLKSKILTADYLRGLDTPALMNRLTALPGVGPKTAGCVAMFWCSRDLMPVDTHILRLLRWLRWVPEDASPEEAFLHCGMFFPCCPSSLC